MGVCAIHSYHKTTPNGTHTAYLFPYICEPDARRSCGWLLHYFVYFRLGTGSLLCQYEPTKIALPVDVDQSSIAGLSCGACHTVLWTDDGACYGFGSNSHSQLPLSTDESQNIENQVSISHGYMDIYDRIQKYCLWFSCLGYTEVGPTRWSFLNPQIYSSNVYEIWECLCTTGDIETEKFSCTMPWCHEHRLSISFISDLLVVLCSRFSKYAVDNTFQQPSPKVSLLCCSALNRSDVFINSTIYRNLPRFRKQGYLSESKFTIRFFTVDL